MSLMKSVFLTTKFMKGQLATDECYNIL